MSRPIVTLLFFICYVVCAYIAGVISGWVLGRRR